MEHSRFRYTIPLVNKRGFRLSIVLLLSLSVGVSFAALDPEFRAQFNTLIKDKIYHSTFEYPLGEDRRGVTLAERYQEYEMVRDDFHRKVNCIFNDSFAGVITEVNRSVEETFGKRLTDQLLLAPALGSGCDQGVFSQAQNQQANLRLAADKLSSLCDPQGDFEIIHTPYSACRVGETLLTELGGYQAYLLAKIQDSQTMAFSEARTQEEADQLRTSLQQTYRDELEKAEQAFADTLFLYETYARHYRMYAWLVALEQESRTTHNLTYDLSGVIQLYETKFPNAASRNCRQSIPEKSCPLP